MSSVRKATFHFRLARKCLIFSLFRDLVALRLRVVKEAIQMWDRASAHDSLALHRQTVESFADGFALN